MTRGSYTFGDTRAASERLRRLAELYEPETRDLLARCGLHSPGLAVDLGCGPGWTTQLVDEVLHPRRTVGLDASERFIEEACRKCGPNLEFHIHDVLQERFPVGSPDALFCRFLMTHLSNVGDALSTWSKAAAPGAILAIHETESLESENAALKRYYDLVGQLQAHYGQALHVGESLTPRVEENGWNVVESVRVALEKPASKMAELHLSNLRTWRHDKFAQDWFNAQEIDSLERSLAAIVSGDEDAGVVVNAARQIVARKK
jgi:trans-aconitate 2-methyltransferase